MNMAKLLHWSLGIHYNKVLLFIYTCIYMYLLFCGVNGVFFTHSYLCPLVNKSVTISQYIGSY